MTTDSPTYTEIRRVINRYSGQLRVTVEPHTCGHDAHIVSVERLAYSDELRDWEPVDWGHFMKWPESRFRAAVEDEYLDADFHGQTFATIDEAVADALTETCEE